MKCLLPLLLLCAGSVFAQPVRFYLGTYTDNPLSQGIYTGTLDTRTGRLSPPVLVAKAKSPTYLALSPDRRCLYALTANDTGTVAAFRLEPDGQLTPLNELACSNVCCHISVDATGRTVFLASYAGGNISAFQTRADGSLDRLTAFFQMTGSGPNPLRQTKPYLHSMYADPENRHVYACDLGTDHVWIYDFKPATGELTPASPSSASVPPGSGPRHLAFSPDGRFAYVNGEMGLNVTTFARNPANGALTFLQSQATLPPGADTNGVTTAEICCHPSGRWLYLSNRGCDTIAVYGIGADGKLTWRQDAPAQVKVPRGFALDPTGRWLVVGGQTDHRIAVLKVDDTTGKLSPTDQTAAVGAPVCVVFK